MLIRHLLIGVVRYSACFCNRIEDNEGNVLANFTPQMDEVISETSAYKMLVMLRAVINEGTGGVYAVYMVLLPIWEERQVQPTVILTVGSWDSPLHWYPVYG